MKSVKRRVWDVGRSRHMSRLDVDDAAVRLELHCIVLIKTELIRHVIYREIAGRRPP